MGRSPELTKFLVSISLAIILLFPRMTDTSFRAAWTPPLSGRLVPERLSRLFVLRSELPLAVAFLSVENSSSESALLMKPSALGGSLVTSQFPAGKVKWDGRSLAPVDKNGKLLIMDFTSLDPSVDIHVGCARVYVWSQAPVSGCDFVEISRHLCRFMK